MDDVTIRAEQRCPFCSTELAEPGGLCPSCGMRAEPCGCVYRGDTRRVTCFDHYGVEHSATAPARPAPSERSDGHLATSDPSEPATAEDAEAEPRSPSVRTPVWVAAAAAAGLLVGVLVGAAVRGSPPTLPGERISCVQAARFGTQIEELSAEQDLAMDRFAAAVRGGDQARAEQYLREIGSLRDARRQLASVRADLARDCIADSRAPGR